DDNESEFEIQRRHVFEPPRSLRELNPQVPEAIEAVVLRALQKDRNKRFASCRDMARALQGESVPIDSTPPPPSEKPKSASADAQEDGKEARRRGYTPTTIQTLEPVAPSPSASPAHVGASVTPVASRRWVSVVVVLLLAVVLGFAGYKAVDSYRAPKNT